MVVVELQWLLRLWLRLLYGYECGRCRCRSGRSSLGRNRNGYERPAAEYHLRVMVREDWRSVIVVVVVVVG